jgi:hypothetical protein
MDKLIILAAGEGSRWGNHRDTPKHILKINGETLLERQVRLFPDFETIIVTSREDYKTKGATLHFPETRNKRALNTESRLTKPLWSKEGRTIVTLGDIYFTEECAEKINNYKQREYKFFGRENEGVTCPYGELFCQSFYPEHHDQYEQAYIECDRLYEEGIIRRNEWWEHYRITEGIDPNVHAVGKMFIEHNDLTDDFDYPQDYDLFIKALNNLS